MAFTGKTRQIDLTLILTAADGKEHTIKPFKKPVLEDYQGFMDKLLEASSEMKVDYTEMAGRTEAERKSVIEGKLKSGEMTAKNLMSSIEGMMSAIDYFYGKGVPFWKENFNDINLLKEILSYITAEFTGAVKNAPSPL